MNELKAQLGVRISPSSYFQLNLDAAWQQGENDRIFVQNLADLSSLIDTNELAEFYVGNTVEFIPLQGWVSVINHWLSLVAHEGTIVFTGTDYNELARLIHLGELDLVKINELVYGIGKKAISTPHVIIQLLQQSGQFVIENIKYEGFTYMVKARRK